MDLTNFNTVQEIIPMENPSASQWVIAIDIGFSGVKGFAPNKRFCFPSYVKKMEEKLNSIDEDDIYYRDDTGTYLIGVKAQDLIRAEDTNDTDSAFDRNRYYTKEFEILARTALAIGLLDNEVKRRHPQDKTFVQTGLPAAYVKEDAKKIRSVFTNSGKFDIKLGNGKWIKFDNVLKNQDISVMSQPAGTLNSIMVDDNGNYVNEAKDFTSKNVLIADVGFGTFDPYGVINRKIVLQESINNLGMKKVLETASAKIYKEYNIDIRIPQMRKFIREGGFKHIDIKNRRSKKIPIAPYIEAACEEVAKESIDKLYTMAGYFADYDILVMTGGTGAAWLQYYREAFADMESLMIIPGNYGNELPIYYANARGYYMSAYMRNKTGKR